MAPYVHRLTTPYHPAALNTASEYGSSLVPYHSQERFAAACVAAVAGFALDAGVERLTVDNPMAHGFFSFSARAGRGGHGLAGLFPFDHGGYTDYHDGAQVPLATALGLVRAMVLRDGTWCRLHTDDGFFLHVGTRDDLYVGDDRPHEGAADRARVLGLVAERVDSSPYDPALDETEPQRPADDTFWDELGSLVAEFGGVLVEERRIGHAYRWHRPTSAVDLLALRGQLTPRARLAVWPDLTEDAEAVRAALLRQERLELLVRQYPGGFHAARIADPSMARGDVPNPQVSTEPGHRSALVPLEPADRHPLLAAVLPDADGVLRARWRTNRTPAEERRSFLASLRVGDVVDCVVATGLDDVGVHVDLKLGQDRDQERDQGQERDQDLGQDPGQDQGLGRRLGFLRTPEMSWEHFDSVDEIAPVGRELRARVSYVDWAFEQVGLSLKALRPDPWLRYAEAHVADETVEGTVTSLMPFGAIVTVEQGVAGLVHLTELADHEVTSPEELLTVGDRVRVALLDMDLDRRRLTLSLRQARPEQDGPGAGDPAQV